MIKSEHKTFYQYSLLTLIIFELIIDFVEPSNGSILKLFLSLYIYISLALLPFKSLENINNYFNTSTIFISFLIIGYGLAILITDVIKGQNIISLFGNPIFGPVFLVPFFILWGAKINSLYWLHRISIMSIKLGILLTPIAIVMSLLEESPYPAFFPTFFLILNYNYSTRKDKMWIILSLIIGIPLFYFSDYRSGIIRIFLSLIVFGIVQLNFKKAYKYFVIIMISLPILLLYIGITKNPLIISQILNVGKEFDQSNLTVDTRTILYTEFLTDIEKTQSLTFGKGAMGSYFSNFFYNWQGEEGDHYTRTIVEVGILQYILRGGIIYLFLISIIIGLAVFKGLKHSKNNYTLSLSLLLSTYFFYMFISNIPAYEFSNAMVWIIIGICLSKPFNKLNETQIRNLLQNESTEKSIKTKRILFNNNPV